MDSENSLEPRLANPALQPVLKEWGGVAEALRQGKTSLLLRKGGIREAGGRFEVPHSRFWLYPTVEHQRAAWLKPEYRPFLDLQPELCPASPLAVVGDLPVAIAHAERVAQMMSWVPLRALAAAPSCPDGCPRINGSRAG